MDQTMSESGSQTGDSQTGASQTGRSQTSGSQTGGSQTAGSQTGGSQTGGSQTGGPQTQSRPTSDASLALKAKRICIETEEDGSAPETAVDSRTEAIELEGTSGTEEEANSTVASKVPVLPTGSSTSVTNVRLDFCKKHQKQTDIWCNTCTIQVCRKCYRVDHKPPCEWDFVDEKCVELSEKFAADLKTIKSTVFSKFAELEMENAENLRVISLSIDEASDLKVELLKYQEILPVKKKAYEDMFASYESLAQPTSTNKLTIEQLLGNLESLSTVSVTDIPDVPSNLLLQQLSSYQCNKDATRNPLDTISFEEELGGGFLASLHHIDGRHSKIIKKSAESLEDGQRWTIHEATSAAAVVFCFRYTSKRPNAFQVRKIRWQKDELAAFKSIIAHANYPVQIYLTEDDWENDFFPSFIDTFCPAESNTFPSCTTHLVMKDCFWKPDEDSFDKTCSRLNIVLAKNKSFKLEQVWGHLDEETLLKLPQTVKNLGLLVRDEDDMISVKNLLFKTAFSVEPYSGRVVKLWPALKEIHLCVVEAFDETDWDLNYSYNDSYRQTKEVNLNNFNGLVEIAVHFPSVTHASIPRVMMIFSNLSPAKKQVPTRKSSASLYLPGSSLSADAVLGALRDHQLWTDVHLPAAHRPQDEEDQKSMQARYGTFNCSVDWDLDPL